VSAIDDILDADQVGQMLHIHPRTIVRLAKQGKIPGFKVGSQWRFRKEAINEYIRNQEQQYISKQGENE